VSNSIMTACWELEIPATQKLVLVALADMANDAGICWPSVPLLVKRTGLSERAVQGAFKWLDSVQVVSIKRERGKANTFTVSPSSYTPAAGAPRTTCPPQDVRHTPAESAAPPPQQVHPTPAAGAPITIIEPSIEPKENPKESADKPLTLDDLVAIGIDRQSARDWLVVRRDKKAKTLTPTAWKALEREAGKAGISAADAVQIAAESNWQTFKAEWWKGNARASPFGSVNKQEAQEARNRAVADEWLRQQGVTDEGSGQVEILEADY
jgi:hypothetical protein